MTTNDIQEHVEGARVTRPVFNRFNRTTGEVRRGTVTRVYSSASSHVGAFHWMYGVTWDTGGYEEGYLNGGLSPETPTPQTQTVSKDEVFRGKTADEQLKEGGF